MSGPLVRSSYRAGRLYQQAVARRGRPIAVIRGILHSMAKDRATTPRGKADRKAKAAKTKAPRGERIRQLRPGLQDDVRSGIGSSPLWMALAFVGAAAVDLPDQRPGRDRAVHRHPDRRDLRPARGRVVFGRRAQKAAFNQAEGQPGAAAWVLEQHARRLAGHPGRRGHHAARRRAPGASAGPASSSSARAPRTGCGRCSPRRRSGSPGSSATPRSTTSSSATTRARCRSASSNNHLMKLPRNSRPGAGQRAGEAAGGAGRDDAAAAAQGPAADPGPDCRGMERTVRRR